MRPFNPDIDDYDDYLWEQHLEDMEMERMREREYEDWCYAQMQEQYQKEQEFIEKWGQYIEVEPQRFDVGIVLEVIK